MNKQYIIDEAKKLIKDSEGLSLKAYLCPANKWTIGYGHTANVKKGDTCTDEQADEFLAYDINYFIEKILKMVKVDISDNQMIALVDFVFNLGEYSLSKSKLLLKINAKDFVGASEEFLKWNKATVNGKLTELKGLTIRREKEKKIFLS